MSGFEAVPDRPEGITLLGSEMLTWSDMAGPVGPVRGDIVRLLLGGRPRERARLLVAGPHEAALIKAVAESFDHTDVLVRSWVDAASLRAELAPGVGIYCGPLGRFPTDVEGYDVVLAVDGLGRLHSAEEERPGWRRSASQLSRLLRGNGEGELFVALRNEVGLDALLALPPDHRHDDESWPEGRVGHDRPGTIEALAAYLAEDHDLRLDESWACFGPVSRPSLAFPTRMAETLHDDPRLGMLVAGASARLPTEPVPLKNPGELARLIARQGLAGTLAPQWVLHFSPGSSAPRGLREQILVSEPVQPDRPAAVYSITVSADAWEREVLTTSAPAARAPRGISSDVDRLASPLLRATPLQDLLADAAAAHDLDAVSDLVRRYADWLGPTPVPRERLALTFEDLALTDSGDLVVVDGRQVADVDAAAETVLLCTLLVAARRLQQRGSRHPWPGSYGPARIAHAMAASTGLEADRVLQDHAVELDRQLRGDPAETGADDLPRSWAELNNLVTQYQTRLVEAEEQVDWLVASIHVRQRTLRFTRGKLESVQSSPEYWIGSRVLWFRALARRLVKRWQVMRHGEQHEWREPRMEREKIPVEPELLPPGYEAKSDEV